MKSDFIQRRYKAALHHCEARPCRFWAGRPSNAIKQATRDLGQLLSGADALFTGLAHAMLLDYHREAGAALLRLKGADLEEYAHREAERDTEDVAQPMRNATLSNGAYQYDPLGKTTCGLLFGSSAEKSPCLRGLQLMCKSEPARFIKTAFLVFGVGGWLLRCLKLWREAKGDDDDKKWVYRASDVGTCSVLRYAWHSIIGSR